MLGGNLAPQPYVGQNEPVIPFSSRYDQGDYVEIRTDGGWGLGADNYGDAMGGQPQPGGPQPYFGNIVEILQFIREEETADRQIPSIYYYRVKRYPYLHNLGNTLVHAQGGLKQARLVAPPLFGGRLRKKSLRKTRKSRKSRKTRKSRK